MKITVLLVEDSKFLKITAERLLAKAGFTVVNAQDGEEALQKVRSTPPDILLLDMMLPKLGGEQVLAALKRDPATANIPVIILTSLSLQNEQKLKNAGAANYFEKAKLIEDMSSGKLTAAIQKAVADAQLPKTAAAQKS